ARVRACGILLDELEHRPGNGERERAVQPAPVEIDGRDELVAPDLFRPKQAAGDRRHRNAPGVEQLDRRALDDDVERGPAIVHDGSDRKGTRSPASRVASWVLHLLEGGTRM